jgi:hypothetical protein
MQTKLQNIIEKIQELDVADAYHLDLYQETRSASRREAISDTLHDIHEERDSLDNQLNYFLNRDEHSICIAYFNLDGELNFTKPSTNVSLTSEEALKFNQWQKDLFDVVLYKENNTEDVHYV